jgi:hypothetical protein
MGGGPVFGIRPEAAPPRPQPDGSAGHDRTRSEGVSTQEADTVLGDPAGVSKHPPNRNGDEFADARLGAGYLSAPAAFQTQIRPVSGRR